MKKLDKEQRLAVLEYAKLYMYDDAGVFWRGSITQQERYLELKAELGLEE